MQRIIEARLLTPMSRDEIFAEATSVYDNYLDALDGDPRGAAAPEASPSASSREQGVGVLGVVAIL